MQLYTFSYNADKLDAYTKERKEFKSKTSFQNVVYFFYKDEKCLYIGETRVSLFDRIFTNSPKEKTKPWFTEGNTIHQIILDSQIDDIARGAIESMFILTYRPKYNKEA